MIPGKQTLQLDRGRSWTVMDLQLWSQPLPPGAWSWFGSLDLFQIETRGLDLSTQKRAPAQSNQQATLLIGGGLGALGLGRESGLYTLLSTKVHPLHPSDMLASSHLKELLQGPRGIFQKDQGLWTSGWRYVGGDTTWLKRSSICWECSVSIEGKGKCRHKKTMSLEAEKPILAHLLKLSSPPMVSPSSYPRPNSHTFLVSPNPVFPPSSGLL